MTNAMERGWLVLILIVAASSSGCLEARSFSCRPRDPRVEAEIYDKVHDPFPDESMGPDTYSRPGAFQLPRTQDYKTYEYKNLRASGIVRPGMAAQPGLFDDTSRRYNVVPY